MANVMKNGGLFFTALFAAIGLLVVLIWYFSSSWQRDAQTGVRYVLKDGESAQFRNLYRNPGGQVCGEVNSKNSFGAYTGFEGFMYEPAAETVILESENSPIYRIYC